MKTPEAYGHPGVSPWGASAQSEMGSRLARQGAELQDPWLSHRSRQVWAGPKRLPDLMYSGGISPEKVPHVPKFSYSH